jgi:pyruvate,water dikinase
VNLIDKKTEVTWGAMYYGRPYWNLGEVKKGLQRLPGFIERNFDEDLGIEITYPGNGFVSRTTPKTLFTGITVLSALGKSFAHQKTYCPDFMKRQREQWEEWERVVPEKMTREEFYRFYLHFIREEYFLSESSYFFLIFDNSNVNSLFKDSFKKHKDKINILKLISGLKNLSHLLPNYDLWQIREKILADPGAKAFWLHTSLDEIHSAYESTSDNYCLSLVRQFIEKYKYHSIKELHLEVPHYGEDPGSVFESLKHLLTQDQRKNPEEVNKKQYDEYLREREKYLALFFPFQTKKAAQALDELRWFLWWREELRDLSTRCYYQIRRFTLILADHFVTTELIKEKEDIFFLTIENIEGVINGDLSPGALKGVVEKNKIYYQGFRHYENPNEIGNRYHPFSLKKGAHAYLKEDMGSGGKGKEEFQGIGCSPGLVKGKVRVIQTIDEAHLIEEGDILVTRFTDPGWTPSFALINGVITETGGLLSHAAVIAREYGIPAVLHVPHAVDLLTSGQTILLDGTKGIIRVMD